MAAKKRDRVYDELINFLADPLFQVPVRTYMDEKCLIFDPAIPEDESHRECHSLYKKMVDALLDGFCTDMDITYDEAIQGINKLKEIPDVKDVFHVLFEQVMAATDFEIFNQVMRKRNIAIQEQVLVMMIAMTGGLPESLLGADIVIAGSRGQPQAQRAAPSQQPSLNLDQQEQAVLRQVMDVSKKEHEKSRHKEKMSEAELTKTLELSKQEATVLQQERQKMEESMKSLTLGGGASAASSKLQQPVQLPPSLAPQSAKPISGAEAANQWLADAQSTVGQSATHSALAASLAKLSPEELKKRQEFLREQRDKLLAKKKVEREKQLGAELSSKPQRPQSARAARAAMENRAAADAKAAEEEKKLAMRRAIAAKLKQEVIEKH